MFCKIFVQKNVAFFYKALNIYKPAFYEKSRLFVKRIFTKRMGIYI